MALRSASVAFEYIFHGIGGMMARPAPTCLPVRIVLMNMSSVHFPIPVSGSGVRFVVKATPTGVDHAVFESLIAVAQPAAFVGGAVIFSLSGWPMNMLLRSGSPLTSRVWHPLQCCMLTRYF